MQPGKRARSVHLIPCELSASQPDRSLSDSGRSTNDDGAGHRGSCQCHQWTHIPFHMAPRSTSPPTILNQTADIQWRGVGGDWQHFRTSELWGPAEGATPFSGSRHGCQPVGSELAPKRSAWTGRGYTSCSRHLHFRKPYRGMQRYLKMSWGRLRAWKLELM